MDVQPFRGAPRPQPPGSAAPPASPPRATRPENGRTVDAPDVAGLRSPHSTGGRPLAPSPLKFTLSAADVDTIFVIHEDFGRVVVTMTDSRSGEVLHQTPPRIVLDTIATLKEMGMTVDFRS